MSPPSGALCPSCTERQGKRFHWCGDRLGCQCPCSKPTRTERRVLLALLADAPRMSGYPLSRLAQVGSGRVYVVLARLEREGWVDAEWGELTPNGGRRRFYRFTPAGREQAMRLLGLNEARP